MSIPTKIGGFPEKGKGSFKGIYPLDKWRHLNTI
jgi:hypothetical protein